MKGIVVTTEHEAKQITDGDVIGIPVLHRQVLRGRRFDEIKITQQAQFAFFASQTATSDRAWEWYRTILKDRLNPEGRIIWVD